jgi:hypothetical protein
VCSQIEGEFSLQRGQGQDAEELLPGPRQLSFHPGASKSRVRRGPRQNRVTWKTPSRVAFVPLQEPVAVLASYVPHMQMPA